MKARANKDIYARMQRFAEVTKRLMIQGSMQRAKRCLQIAENNFISGDAMMKNAIINVYVFSVSSFLELHHSDARLLLPKSLHHEYDKQIYATGT